MKVICENETAEKGYELGEPIEAGLCLKGTEVKTIRYQYFLANVYNIHEKSVEINNGYVTQQNGEMYLHDVAIKPYYAERLANHEALRPRKLLLKKKEISMLARKMAKCGLVIIPLKLYINSKSRVKVLIACAKSKGGYVNIPVSTGKQDL